MGVQVERTPRAWALTRGLWTQAVDFAVRKHASGDWASGCILAQEGSPGRWAKHSHHSAAPGWGVSGHFVAWTCLRPACVQMQ